MKKNFSLLTILAVGILFPSLSLAQISGSQNFTFTPPQFSLPPANPVLTCAVEGSIRRVNNVSNEITYKVYYNSNYEKINAKYSVVGSVDKTTHVSIVYQVGGAFSFPKGKGYATLQGSTEQKFTFPISGNPSVLVAATLDGVKCTAKNFKTIQPIRIIAPSPQVPDLKLNPNVSVTSSGNIQIPPADEDDEAPAPVVAQDHTCKVITEAMLKDSDSILIGAAIDFDNLKAGKYPYVVRGYKNDDPNNVTKYEGTYTSDGNNNKYVLNSDGRGFLFNYDSQSANDGYVITATLGNIDCSAVLFPSPLKLQAQAGAGAQGSAGGSVGSQGSGSANPGTVAGSAQGQVVGSGEVAVVGQTEADAKQAADLNLIEEEAADDSDEEAADEEEYAEMAAGEDDSNWTAKDYTVVGLLGGIFAAIAVYIGMRYRGMM